MITIVYTFSSIANNTKFAGARAPIPLIVVIERITGQLQIASNSTIVEFNLWEIGSYDLELAIFTPLKYIGSNFENSTVGQSRDYIKGVDNAGFIIGTLASLFNQAFL
jgi:lysophospholipase